MLTEFSHFRFTSTLRLFVAAFAIAGTAQSQAAGTHPLTGDALSDDQTFTTACWTSSRPSIRS